MVDSNKSYCLRLASITFPLLPTRPAATAASRHRSGEAKAAAEGLEWPTIAEELSQLFGRECNPPTSCLADRDSLAAALELRPDVQSRLAVITQYTPSKWLLERELEAANLWPDFPASAGQPAPVIPLRLDKKPDAYETARHRSATGLCLSGGGIRSATFNLGILQALSRHDRIGKFQYLASVSGGGYIHQFLANWIHRTRDLHAVESLLDPIPNEPVVNPIGRHSTVQPEPLRWLRRYSNYLAPRKGLFSLDTWTVAAVWVRNTVLNLVIVLSSLYFLLLLPQIGTMPFVSFEGHDAKLSMARWTLAIIFTFVVLILSICLSDTRMPGARPVVIKFACASLFGAAALFSPTIYRSVLPGGSIDSNAAREVFTRVSTPAHLHYKGSFQQQTPASELVEVTVDANGPEPHSPLRDHWSARPPLLIRDRSNISLTPVLLFVALCTLLLFSVLTSGEANPMPSQDANVRGMDPDEVVQVNRAEERAKKVRVARTVLFLVVGLGVLYGMLEGVRLLFFVACFAVPRERIPGLGVALLPTLLFGIPLLLMEFGLGMLGRDADSGQREWLARLRAFSFLLGALWCALTSFSLLGPSIVHILARYTVTSYTLWAGWLATTVGGLVSAQSSRTTNSEAGKEEAAPKTNRLLELIAAIAPSVFIVGLLLLISTFVAWSLFVSHVPNVNPHQLLLWKEHRFLLLALVSLSIALLFGWRIDINDFSMHAFYRDRLARCYAGAVNPNRRPNLFTGFDRDDRDLRVHDLLPENQHRRNDRGDVSQVGTYKGPFPIICTAINLTTGEDLAYQERKAASFAFTPLFSGYNVGWTSALSPVNQFNGFVDTPTYVYAKSGSITLATACAISGAAASPSMGYHSSPSIAFLLTVFNVRLGWWLRNPRRRRILRKTPYPLPPTPPEQPSRARLLVRKLFPLRKGLLPSSPRFGLLKLITELLGQSNDTTSYIYLTDGGHFDNMGLYELLRRRCRTVIVCDGEADSHLHFEGIGMAIRKARLDFGVEVTLDQTDPVPPRTPFDRNNCTGFPVDHTQGRHRPAHVQEVSESPKPQTTSATQSTDPGAPSPEAERQQNVARPVVFSAHMSSSPSGEVSGTISRQQSPAAVSAGLSSFEQFPGNSVHCVHGTIRYPEDSGPDQFGHILYVKASLTGDEPPDILNYRRQHAAFPHDTTLNQFFTESQFESYRRLGEHIILTDKTALSWLDRYLGPV